MEKSKVSIYTFELNQGVSEEQLICASAQVDALLLRIDGFMYRSLTRIDGGQWQDIMYWNSEAARARGNRIESSPAFDAFISLIDERTVSFQSNTIVTQVYPQMEVA
ncbi:hypothetical protein WKI13_18180 [Teredinibacter turnerae]|uniref:hypothetical protein n=1 Tax=Teredinibacter turnerae TaxID=2426 RepID=UPI00037F4DCC|nr:hypothetical protein [Teredinibacter turnerae]